MPTQHLNFQTENPLAKTGLNCWKVFAANQRSAASRKFRIRREKRARFSLRSTRTLVRRGLGYVRRRRRLIDDILFANDPINVRIPLHTEDAVLG